MLIYVAHVVCGDFSQDDIIGSCLFCVFEAALSRFCDIAGVIVCSGRLLLLVSAGATGSANGLQKLEKKATGLL